MTRVVAIVQARMTSSRLPGKILQPIGGRPMLYWVIHRLRAATTLDDIRVATTDLSTDDATAALCAELGVPVFRGDENDVLDRYTQAARVARADAVVRITSDCPLIDPALVDQVVERFLADAPDYVSNSLVPGYPRGLDVEAFSRDALEKSWSEARQPFEREHVTPFLYRNPDRFKILSVTAASDHSGHRWTVDTQEDLDLVREIHARLPPDSFRWEDVLEILEREPALADINRHVVQKSLTD